MFFSENGFFHLTFLFKKMFSFFQKIRKELGNTVRNLLELIKNLEKQKR